MSNASNDRLNYRSYDSVTNQINYLDRNVGYLTADEKNDYLKIKNQRSKLNLSMGIIWGSLFVATNLTGSYFTKRISVVQRILGFVIGGFGAMSYALYENQTQSNVSNILFLQTIQRKVEREGHF